MTSLKEGTRESKLYSSAAFFHTDPLKENGGSRPLLSWKLSNKQTEWIWFLKVLETGCYQLRVFLENASANPSVLYIYSLLPSWTFFAHLRYLDFLFGWHMTCLNRAEKLLQAQETALGTWNLLLPVCLSVCRSVCLPAWLSNCLPVCCFSPVCLKFYANLFCLPACLPVVSLLYVSASAPIYCSFTGLLPCTYTEIARKKFGVGMRTTVGFRPLLLYHTISFVLFLVLCST